MKKAKNAINFPTILTLARIILVAPLMIFMFNDGVIMKVLALICFIVAAVTDFVDGRLARKNDQVTDLGIFLDPLADKMLVNLTFFALCVQGVIVPWIFGIILIRDFAVDGMRMMIAKKGEAVAASKIGKAKTMTQMFALVFTMITVILTENGQNIDILNIISAILLCVAVILTIWSGLDYLIKGWKKAIIK